MRIGIVAEPANLGVKTGIEHSAKQLILGLAAVDETNHYRLYLRTEPEPWLRRLPANFELRIIPFGRGWTLIALARELRRDPVDALLAFRHVIPLIHPQRTVINIYDLGLVRAPELETAWNRRLLPLTYRILFRRTWRIIVPSQSTADDITSFAPTIRDRLRVVHLGYTREITTGLGRPAAQARIGDPYVLFLSSLHPRKNVVRLIDAFVSLRRSGTVPHKLVIAGALGWNYEQIVAKIEQHKDVVVYLGYVDTDTRWALYQGADLYVLPSLFEGFGLGMLEAFDAGVPVAASNTSSLPEVAGDAAIYFDPLDAAEIASAITRGLTDQELRERLIANGRKRLDRFSWERAAAATVAVLTGC